MAVVAAEEIRGLSWTLRVFRDGDEPGKTPYIALLRLDDLGGGTCRIAATMGELSEDINVAIALKAIDLGFSELEFSTLKGQPANHWMAFEGRDDIYDYWRIDLNAALVKYKGAG
jgi:hypothetical protein